MAQSRENKIRPGARKYGMSACSPEARARHGCGERVGSGVFERRFFMRKKIFLENFKCGCASTVFGALFRVGG